MVGRQIVGIFEEKLKEGLDEKESKIIK